MSKVDIINLCNDCSHAWGYSLHTSWCNKLDREVSDNSIDQDCPLMDTDRIIIPENSIIDLLEKLLEGVSHDDIVLVEKWLTNFGVKVVGEDGKNGINK